MILLTSPEDKKVWLMNTGAILYMIEEFIQIDSIHHRNVTISTTLIVLKDEQGSFRVKESIDEILEKRKSLYEKKKFKK